MTTTPTVPQGRAPAPDYSPAIATLEAERDRLKARMERVAIALVALYELRDGTEVRSTPARPTHPGQPGDLLEMLKSHQGISAVRLARELRLSDYKTKLLLAELAESGQARFTGRNKATLWFAT